MSHVLQIGGAPPADTRYLTARTSLGALAPRTRITSDAGILSLNGRWRFRHYGSAREAPAAALGWETDDSTWSSLDVPAHWELNGHGTPVYLESRYPIPLDPPHVPDENPTGDYRRVVVVPAQWVGGRIVLRLDGVESGALVVINGRVAGWAQGSRLTHEFDVTDLLRPGEPALVAIRVHSWTAGTYLEDQDTWRMTGITREVALLHRPRNGLEDVVVESDYDQATGMGSLTIHGCAGARVRIPELGISAAAGERVTCRVEPWTAERPRLYDLTVASAGEIASLRLGFRRVEISEGQLRVNGRRIVFRGVNRHDFHPDRGRAVTEEDIRADLVAMKRNNINAVRTAHYPPPPLLLELCDRLGLYVIDECDLETHGYSDVGWIGNPVGDDAWEAAVLDRMERMVARDRNHTCVVMWSIGNECGAGELLERMRQLSHRLDPSRPVHYENDRPRQRYSDVYSRMYATPAEVEAAGRYAEPRIEDDPGQDLVRRAQPFVLCEYAHAMGTGPGGLRTYQDLFHRYPRLQGGFVWEWSDQALRATDENGRQFYAYGGDFGEEIHDGPFICDGLVKPDRTAGSALVEVKSVFAPVALAFDRASGSLTITNHRDFETLDDLEFAWRIDGGGELLARGTLHPPRIHPAASAVLTLDGLPGEADTVLTIRASTARDQEWAPRGHDVVTRAWRIGPRTVPRPLVDDRVRLRRSEGEVLLGDARFDDAGELVAIGPIEVRGLYLDVWRAPTDNDLAAPAMDQWRFWLKSIQHRVESVAFGADSVETTIRSIAPGRNRGFRTYLRWAATRTGTVVCEARVVPDEGWSFPLPRIGLGLVLSTEITEVWWEGLGPGESYPDMRDGATLGTYTCSVAGLQSHQARPQENGHRSDVSWLELHGPKAALRLRADPEIGFTARHWSTADLEAAKHPTDLVDRGRTYVTLDLAVHGLGSAACGPDVLPEHACIATERAVLLELRALR